ncbi:hypothetical protein [Bifidobacterium vansinderenii]|uniref:Uncharacterized protein n=1 Tax=Bifidobacterium vansinderenii TaxID=1984871 RepID=A0A229W1A5_9BIFI|nr:hypothetical protein [Bifidobacterium vansinderenii]OXN01643.1 hypothetical protein Tam10B_0085 [Bifidobacterium vansinderenii]
MSIINITKRDHAYQQVLNQIHAMRDTSIEHIDHPDTRQGYLTALAELEHCLNDWMRPPKTLRPH